MLPEKLLLNGLCPYFTMFPLAFPLGVMNTVGGRGWLLDPFCGRGTSNFAARLLGRNSIGIDSSPVAVAIASAKLVHTSPAAIVRTAAGILSDSAELETPQGDFWDLAFESTVLKQLSRLRAGLMADARSDARKALSALILGALHGPLSKRSLPMYLSNQSQRTYSPKPGYAVRYWRARRLVPPKVDVLEVIRRRAERFFAVIPKKSTGEIVRADATTPSAYADPRLRQVTIVITSPPYFGLRTYLPDQWLRLWFLGGGEAVNYSEDDQIRHRSIGMFTDALNAVWSKSAAVVAGDARLVVRFGSLSSRPIDAIAIMKSSLCGSGWRLQTVKRAGASTAGRRQAAQFRSPGEAREEFDFWCVRE